MAPIRPAPNSARKHFVRTQSKQTISLNAKSASHGNNFPEIIFVKISTLLINSYTICNSVSFYIRLFPLP